MIVHKGSPDRRRQMRGLTGTEPPRAQLVSMILGTFLEMPGLCLHGNQAARLFGLRQSTCSVVLDDLVTQGKLRRAADGQYVAAQLTSAQLPTPRWSTLKRP
jgi:hypothetical protein